MLRLKKQSVLLKMQIASRCNYLLLMTLSFITWDRMVHNLSISKVNRWFKQNSNT